MNCRKQERTNQVRLSSRRRAARSQTNREHLKATLEWLMGDEQIFADCELHGNIKWKPDELAMQALCWAWQESRNVTESFVRAQEACADLRLTAVAQNYTTFMDALSRHHELFHARLGQRFQDLAAEVGGRFWRDGEWTLLAFDGSRLTAPRTVSNETAFCASNFGTGKTARYRRKKSQGMRRRQNERNKPQPPEPQVWITMFWHMGLRLPWTWRLGPSHASERDDVMELLEHENLPENTLFCGDAGFIGYPLWQRILASGHNFMVRVGANVHLLSQSAAWRRAGDGMVLCWPANQMNSGAPPLQLRLVRVKIGKTVMWILVSILDSKRLSIKKIIKYYQMRWGIEIEFRGLKHTLDNHKLQCRNSERAKTELDWSIRAMAVAELLAIREQVAAATRRRKSTYTPRDMSLASVMRAIRNVMRQPDRVPEPHNILAEALATAVVQRYNRRSPQRARYRPHNPDKKPLGDPIVRPLRAAHRQKWRDLTEKIAA